jgi:hypothetical protein
MTDTAVAMPIHTSDRIAFKKCRRAWDYSSKLRQNRTAIKVPLPLDFGTAIHAGLETWYEPLTWTLDRETIFTAALARFHEVRREQKKEYFKYTNGDWPDEEQEAEYEDSLVLGTGMLRGYMEWSVAQDAGFRPIGVEVPFEVPIDVPDGVSLRGTGFCDVDGKLFVEHDLTSPTMYVPVVYRGRIDILMEEIETRYHWIWDHKTVGRDLDGATEFLELDEQCTSYGWAYWATTGIRPRGIVYNQLWKGVAAPPAVLDRAYKGRWLSTNKQQATSYELFLETAQSEDPGGLKQGLYDEYLAYLKNEGKTYFRRTQVPRSPRELENMGKQVAYEAMDMLDNPFIYPNPNQFGCKWCMFRSACLVANEGGDVKYVIDSQFKERV